MLALRRVSVVLAAAIAVLPIAPPEHVHERMAPDGHHDSITHRHVQAHVVDFAGHEHHHNPAVDDEDSTIITLDPVLPKPNTTYVPVAPSLSFIGVVQAPMTLGRVVPPEFVERLIHGPPRAPSALRGPPSLSLLS